MNPIRRWVLSGALLVAFGALGVEAWREISASRVIALSAVTERSHVLSANNLLWETACAPACPVRADLARAAARLSVAVRTPPSPQRAELLSDAETLIDHATAVEPLNGPAWSEKAYLQSVRKADDPAALVLLQHSYEVQRFQRATGRWRVAYCGRRWGALTPDLRRRVLDEAQWLWSIDPSLRSEIAADFPTEGGELALSLRVGESSISAPTDKS